MRDPDVRLMLEVRDGKASAFESLMHRYQGRVLSVLRHMVQDSDWAEDLTQEVFLRVFRARLTYEPGSKFTTWLFTITNNVALNALRGKHRHPVIQFGGNDGTVGKDSDEPTRLENNVPASSSLIPVKCLDRKELRSVVQEAIDSLGERQKMATLLSRFEGMSYLDIAETMNLTPQAVKSLLCRARINLRNVLMPYIEQGKLPAIDRLTAVD